ncbi:MAG: CBS domain-containing protein, partial [Chthoniobacteraceae bacterium]
LAAGFGWAVPGLEMHLGLAALVGMAAMFAGASRALLASVVFAFETTLQPHTLPALLGGAAAAYLVSTLLQRHSIMTERIARRGISVPHTYESDPLQHIQVGEVMETDLQTIPSSMTLEELATRIGANDPLVARRQASLVVDDHRALVGIITRGDVVKAVETLPGDRSVLEAATRNFVVTFPDETLHQALARMLEHGIGRLPVVERTNPTVAVGYLGRAHFLAAKLLQLEEGNRREPGWLDRKGRGSRPGGAQPV